MTTLARFDLTPLFRSSVGFDRFSQLFDNATRGVDTTPSYPPYNIEKLSADDYKIVLAVAGFKESDITITTHENQLVVSGKIEDSANKAESTFLYKGIAARAFESKFGLADHVKVISASLADGLLTIELQREVPESHKPRMIPINANTPAKKVIEGKKAN